MPKIRTPEKFAGKNYDSRFVITLAMAGGCTFIGTGSAGAFIVGKQVIWDFG